MLGKVIVELDELSLVDGTDTELTFDDRDGEFTAKKWSCG